MTTPTAPAAWATYGNYRSTLAIESIEYKTLTDTLDSVFRLKDGQAAQLKDQLVNLKSAKQADVYSQIPLPYDEILYNNADLFLNAGDADVASIQSFLSSVPFNDIIDVKTIAGPMAKVIFANLQASKKILAFGISDSKCYEQHAPFLTAGQNGKVLRVDFHTVSFDVQDPTIQTLCGTTVTTLSQVTATVDTALVTKNLSSIVEQLYLGDDGVTRKEQQNIIKFITDTINHTTPGATLIKRPARFPQATQAAIKKQLSQLQTIVFVPHGDDPTAQKFVFTLPMGTAGSARGAIQAWMQSSIQYQSQQAGQDKVWDCVCTETGETGSTLELLVSSSGVNADGEETTLESWVVFGWFDFVKGAAQQLLVYGADYVIKTFGQK